MRAPSPGRRQVRRGLAALLAAAALLSPGCAGASRWERALADPSGTELAALVDSARARRLLVGLLHPAAAGAGLDAHTAHLVSDAPMAVHPASGDRDEEGGGLPDQAGLRDLAAAVSMDYAALTFARLLGADARSRALQAAYDRALAEGADRSEQLLRSPGAFPYTVLLAPSWLYRSAPQSGADFARQRGLLERLGIPHRLIATAESGAVEVNAATVAEAVREARRRGETVIVISASKSGAEAALALARLLEPEETDHVAGWLNVAGALYGTPIVDAALRPPAEWILRALFRMIGWDWAGAASMATAPSRRRLAGARMPASIAVVNLVAVPVSGSVGRRVYGGYEFLRPHGPNDGVVLLADTVWPGGANLVALGADHLMTSSQTDAHALALLRAMDLAVRLQAVRPGPAPAATRPGPDG
jgi:hypothetical protein